MLGQFLAKQALAGAGRLASGAMFADLECARATARADEANNAGRQYDQRKRHPEKEDANEGGGGEHQHRLAFERAAADAVHRLKHNRKHRRFQAEEERGHGRHTTESGIDVAQGHDGDDAGHDKEPARDNGPRPAMHQPANIDGELVRFRARQQHAVAQRVQKPRFTDPFLLIDDDAVHHRYLAGRAAKAECRHPQPHSKRLAERDAVRRRGPGSGSD